MNERANAEIDAGVIRKVADVLMGLFGNLARDQAEYAATDLARRGLLTSILPPGLPAPTAATEGDTP